MKKENQKKQYTKICVSLDNDILEKVRDYCADNRRKITQLVEEALYNFMRHKGGRYL